MTLDAALSGSQDPIAGIDDRGEANVWIQTTYYVICSAKRSCGWYGCNSLTCSHIDGILTNNAKRQLYRYDSSGMAPLVRYGMEMSAMQERPSPGAGHWLLTGLWRALAGTTNASHRRPYSPPYYLESARVSREIDHL